MTYSCADVAERRPHSAGFVQTLRVEKEIGKDADRQTDGRTLAAFVPSVSVEARKETLRRPKARETPSKLLSKPADGQEETCEALII